MARATDSGMKKSSRAYCSSIRLGATRGSAATATACARTTNARMASAHGLERRQQLFESQLVRPDEGRAVRGDVGHGEHLVVHADRRWQVRAEDSRRVECPDGVD